jgi:hypothetical protein
MRLCHLRIERFRGIRLLDWTLRDRVCCLIGAGDNCKTTILDAITLLGSPRTPSFDDFDFYGGSPGDGPIIIEGVFGELPARLLADHRFGLDLLGIDDEGTAHDEPADFEPGIRVRLDVDATLEPVWRLMSARNPDGRLLSARDRASLVIGRLGANPDRQFSLARGTALSRNICDTDQVGVILSAAYRAARTSVVAAADLSVFDSAVESVANKARDVGAGSIADHMSIGLEISPTAAGGLTLQSGAVPVSGAGLGTRRLLALGLEIGITESVGLVCIDEIEHGLEPHRIRHLVSLLSNLVAPDEDRAGGQLIFTTHSPVVLGELGAEGEVEARPVDSDLTGLVRSTPDALLASRVIVGEGKTEVGLLRTYGDFWVTDHGESLAQKGISIVDGGGQNAAKRALDLAGLGLPVLLVADSDVALKPSATTLAAAGVVVVQWAGSMSTEQRLAADLSPEGLQAAFEAVVDEDREPAHVIDAILASAPGTAALRRLGAGRSDVGDDLEALRAAGLTEEEIREAFGTTAKSKNAWFKRIDHGETLGRIAVEDPTTPGTDFGKALSMVEKWCHG